MNLFAAPLGMLLTTIYNFLGHYGFTLIILTLIVRLILFPIYAHQIKSSAKLAEVQPKMQAIQRQYANDRETMSAKMMELYKEEKYNPMQGCLPALLQFPIIMGLFSLLRNPALYLSQHPHMIIATHENFFWISDLSQPDAWVLPIGAGIATYFSFTLTQKNTATGDVANQMAPMMKMMKYIFPIMIVVMGRSFPAGLSLYWFIGTLVQILQTMILQRWRKSMLEKKKAKGE
jgi:YidC/Oxa1 family membrane protein insertase